MDLVLVQQENIARAPAGVRVGPGWSLGIAPSANPSPNPQVPQSLVGWVPLTSLKPQHVGCSHRDCCPSWFWKFPVSYGTPGPEPPWLQRARSVKAGDKCPKVTMVAAGE